MISNKQKWIIINTLDVYIELAKGLRGVIPDEPINKSIKVLLEFSEEKGDFNNVLEVNSL